MYFGPNDPSRNVDITGDINFGRGIYRNDNTNVGKLKCQPFPTFLRNILKSRDPMAHKGEIPWHIKERSHGTNPHIRGQSINREAGGRLGSGGVGGGAPHHFSTFLDGSFGPKSTGKHNFV